MTATQLVCCQPLHDFSRGQSPCFAILGEGMPSAPVAGIESISRGA